MRNQRAVYSMVLALLLPVTLGLACVKRNWDFCSPSAPCKTGYICTEDWRCMLPDGGSDGLVPVDGHGTAVAAEGGLDGPAPTGTDGPGGTAPGPDAVDSAGSTVPDAAPSTPGIDAAGGAGGSSGGPDAASDVLPAPSDAPSLLTLGSPCSVGNACASGICADAVCCDKDCIGCNACAQALTGQPSGTCAPVISGKNAHNFCKDETTTKKCGNDGTCDGAGACRNASTSVVCTDSSCNGSVYTPVSTCDGKGACVAVKTQDCAPFLCAQTGCSKTCTTAADCDSTTSYCDTVAKTCAAKLSNGRPASSGSQCTSGVVADGVCCDKACTGCSACTRALNGQTDGQCLPVPAGQTAHNACAASNVPCGLTGMCDGAGSCQFGARATPCGSTCTGSTLTPKTCDGAGACVSGTSRTCDNSAACDGDVCGAKKTAGATCTTGTDCASGKCVDNMAGTSKICCSSACSGTCQACNSDGSGCTTKNAGAADSACGTSASCQTGTCQSGGTCQQAAAGTNCATNLYCTGSGQCTCQAGGPCQPIAACMQGAYSCFTGAQVCNPTVAWGTNHSCGPGQSCSGKTKTLAQNCNGSGQCPAPSAETCLYRCNSQGTDCDNTNYCSPNPCLNGGTCTNTTSTYTCTCAGGWGGSNCATKLFEGLGMLPDPYAVSSYARGVSADGSTVVGEGYGSYEETSLGFKWTTATGMTDLRYSGNVDTAADAISAFGIVGHNQFTTEVAIVWIGSTDYNLKDLNSYGSEAIAVSDNGVIVGGAFNSNHAIGTAVRWASLAAEPMALDVSGSHGVSRALGVSSDGGVVVGETADGAFRWTAAGLTILPGTGSSAKAVSANGSITVGSSSNSPVRWTGTAGPMLLGTGNGQALAVNGDGTVIVGTTPNGAFIWDNTNGRRLLATVLTTAGANLSGWTMDVATSVSSDGKVIVGYGGHLGTTEAWIARLP